MLFNVDKKLKSCYHFENSREAMEALALSTAGGMRRRIWGGGGGGGEVIIKLILIKK